MQFNINRPAKAVACSPFRPAIVAAGLNQLKQAEFLSSTDTKTREAHVGQIYKVIYSQKKDDQFIMTCAEDGRIKLWNDDLDYLNSFQHVAPVIALALASDNTKFAYADRKVEITIKSRVYGYVIGSTTQKLSLVCDLDFASDGNCLASAEEDGHVRIWDSTDLNLITTLPRHSGPVHAVRFIPKKNLLVTAGTKKINANTMHGEIRFWDITTWKEACKPILTDSGALSLDASAKGGRSVVGFMDGRIGRIALAGENPLKILAGKHSRPVYAVAFENQTNQVLSGSEDGHVMLQPLSVV